MQDVVASNSLAAELSARLEALERAGLRRVELAMRRGAGATVRVGDRDVVDFSSNDYLGLAADPRLAEAAIEALKGGPTGAAAARLISGTHPLHYQLEQALAAFKRAPAALLFTSGYAANTGAIPALAGPGDTIYSDALNHASLIDACRLSRARVRIFPHADLDALARMLEADPADGGARWIVVEGAYSMDGDLFPLDRLVQLARDYGAFTYVDDAHAVGILGPAGRGAPEHWGVENDVDVVMGTLGKAFGVAGAFVCGPESLREWLLNRSRSFVFSTGSPPALAAAALAALDIITTESERRERLWANARRLKEGLRTLGIELDPELPGHILPVPMGSVEATMRAGSELRQLGFLVGAIRPPSVPEGGSRLRITVSAAHSDEQIDSLLDALETVLPRPR